MNRRAFSRFSKSQLRLSMLACGAPPEYNVTGAPVAFCPRAAKSSGAWTAVREFAAAAELVRDSPQVRSRTMASPRESARTPPPNSAGHVGLAIRRSLSMPRVQTHLRSPRGIDRPLVIGGFCSQGMRRSPKMSFCGWDPFGLCGSPSACRTPANREGCPPASRWVPLPSHQRRSMRVCWAYFQ